MRRRFGDTRKSRCSFGSWSWLGRWRRSWRRRRSWLGSGRRHQRKRWALSRSRGRGTDRSRYHKRKLIFQVILQLTNICGRIINVLNRLRNICLHAFQSVLHAGRNGLFKLTNEIFECQLELVVVVRFLALLLAEFLDNERILVDVCY